VSAEGLLAGNDQSLDADVRAYLRQRFGPRFSGLHVRALAGDASTRRYFRVQDAGPSAVLALYPEPFVPEDMSFLVVREVLAGCGLAVPSIEDADGARRILLQQDLGDMTLQEALRGAAPGARDALYDEAIEQLVQLQRESSRAPQQAICFRLAFDVEKLCFELQHFATHFLEGHRGVVLSAADRNALSDAFTSLAQEIATWPRVLCHRDYHSRNLMVHGGGLYWVDFQDARMGPSMYDLASLLRDSYVDLDEDFIEQRAARFGQRTAPDQSAREHARRFGLMALQRNLKALGTFGYMHSVRGSTVYLPHVPRTLAHVRRNLERYPEVAELRQMLGRHIGELA
jgi:N-acetylmuramate 1-kinase